MDILVGHDKSPSWGFKTPAYPEDYLLVAMVTVPDDTPREKALETAFSATNHFSHPWWQNKGVTRLVKEDIRSTSVGDVVVFPDGEVWRCANMGWEFVPTPKAD